MSEIKYGLISSVDADCLIKTIETISKSSGDGFVNITEVGVYAGQTGNWLRRAVKYYNRKCYITGIDNNKDGETLRFQYDKLIIGNSSEVYNQLEDESQHLIFIDGCHTFPAVIADFFCFCSKVKVGGFLAFHDTGVHIDKLHGWQGVGDNNDPDMCLGGVRKALKEIGLFNKWGGCSIGGEMIDHTGCRGFELVFDEADPNDLAGGICVFKKLY